MASTAAAGRIQPVALSDLTVPAARLPAGCTLSLAANVRMDGNRFRGGLWAGLPIESNPWTGTDASVIVALRQRLDPPLLEPDGPPLVGRQRARFFAGLAEGIDAGYAGIYLQAESTTLTVVYGLKFPTGEAAAEFWDHARVRLSKNPAAVGIVNGPMVAVVSGDGGKCYQAVAAHLKSLGS
jgi:hypothetical protein